MNGRVGEKENSTEGDGQGLVNEKGNTKEGKKMKGWEREGSREN